MAAPKTAPRFGIGEWYGNPFASLSNEKRSELAEAQFADAVPQLLCPFLTQANGEETLCWKKGGVCSLRLYAKAENGDVTPAEPTVRATCPSRFLEAREIFRWIGEELLDDPDVKAVGQVPFLERVPLAGGQKEGARAPREVGRIDNVVVRARDMEWHPVEVQAVYFSGRAMSKHFREIIEAGGALVFPAHQRRPDYRSSGPKRLLPQLLTKVPTLRGWARRTAVVVDEEFFNAMGIMATVPHLTSAEVVWFVVAFQEQGGQIKLVRRKVALTTLATARDGLIAGTPPEQKAFEAKLRKRLKALESGAAPTRGRAR